LQELFAVHRKAIGRARAAENAFGYYPTGALPKGPPRASYGGFSALGIATRRQTKTPALLPGLLLHEAALPRLRSAESGTGLDTVSLSGFS